jgi:hypothetical protein
MLYAVPRRARGSAKPFSGRHVCEGVQVCEGLVATRCEQQRAQRI